MCDATNTPIVLGIALNFVEVQFYVKDGRVDCVYGVFFFSIKCTSL